MKNLNPSERDSVSRSNPTPPTDNQAAAGHRPALPGELADAEAKAKPPTVAEAEVIAKEAVKLAKEQEKTLQTGVVAARESLGFALRVMIGNDVPETDASRLLVENAFEAAKHASAGGKAKRADLVAAAAGLQHAENHLANRSLKFPGDLATVRSAVRKATGVLETIPE